MIDFAKKTEIVPGIICPKCHLALPSATTIETQTDRYKRTTRHYFGWCCGCDCGFEVIQFKSGQTWLVHKYRSYMLIKENIIPADYWQMIHLLPEPAPIVTGPGGDYDTPVELSTGPLSGDAGCFNALLILQKTLQKTTRLIEQLLKAVK